MSVITEIIFEIVTDINLCRTG